MHTVHRIYVGARNTPSRKFLPQDENQVAAILKKYLRGWTITKSVGHWGSATEETLIITIVQSPQNQTGWGSGIESAVPEIAAYLGQYAVMWESNGNASIVETGKKLPVTSTATKLPSITVHQGIPKKKAKAK